MSNFEVPIMVELRKMLDKTERYMINWPVVYKSMQGLEGEMYTPRQLHAAAKLLQHALRYVEDRGLGKAENPTVSYYNLGVYGICPVYISAADILERLMNDVQDLANAKGGIVSHNTADVLFEEAIDGQS